MWNRECCLLLGAMAAESRISGIATSADGEQIWTASDLHSNVRVFDGEGRRLLFSVQLGSIRPAIGTPCAIAPDLHGQVFVCSFYQNTVAVLRQSDGCVLRIVGCTGIHTGKLWQPVALNAYTWRFGVMWLRMATDAFRPSIDCPASLCALLD